MGPPSPSGEPKPDLLRSIAADIAVADFVPAGDPRSDCLSGQRQSTARNMEIEVVRPRSRRHRRALQPNGRASRWIYQLRCRWTNARVFRLGQATTSARRADGCGAESDCTRRCLRMAARTRCRPEKLSTTLTSNGTDAELEPIRSAFTPSRAIRSPVIPQ